MVSFISPEAARIRQLHSRLARYNALKRSDLLPPPAAGGLLAPDNLVPVAVMEAGLEISVSRWDLVRDGDTLLLSYVSSGGMSGNLETVIVNDADTQTFPIVFNIHEFDGWPDGTYNINYKVTAASLAEHSSEPLVFIIDRTAPDEGNVPEALIYPDDIKVDGITTEYLAANNNQVIVTVPGYNGMEAGQSVNVVWNNQPLEKVTITSDDVTNNAVLISVSGDIIRASGEGPVEAHYYLTSRAGFDGLESKPAVVSVILKPQPANLYDPEVPLADDDLIDLQDANTGVIIVIQKYSNALSGDSILPKWGATNLPVISVIESNFPIEVPVSRAVIMGEGSGTKTVSYQVIRDDRSFDSPTIEVKVNVDYVGPVDPDEETPVNEALTAPQIIGGSGGEVNALLPEDSGKDASVTVPYYAEAKVGDIITIYWGSGDSAIQLQEYTVIQGDIDAQAFSPFTVAASIVDATPNDPKWPVYYTLSSSVEPANPILSVSQEVNVFLKGPSDLQPATFPDANAAGWLLTANVENGCKIAIAIYNNMLQKDTVTLTWQSYSTLNASDGNEIAETTYTESKTVGAPELAEGVNFVVPYTNYIDVIAGASADKTGSGKVSYTVTQSGVTFASESSVVPIDLGIP